MEIPINQDRVCSVCNGTGIDAIKTKAYHKTSSDKGGYIRCWNCNGNGLNPLNNIAWASPTLINNGRSI
jgi:DnaJ-class molecular chaperone